MRTATRGAVAATALLLTGAGASVPTADAAFPGHRGRIAFGLVSRHPGAPDTSDIWTSRVDGTHRVRLTTSGRASAPTWNKTGRRIAYMDSGAIAVMAADGSQKQRLVTSGYNSSPTWSPDGHRLAFVSDRGEGQGQQVYIYNLRTRALRQVTTRGTSGARASDPAWSPTGGPIAFVRDTGGQSDLYTVRTDGSGLHRVTSTSTVSEQGPDWSPDGKKLVYYRYTGYGDGCFGDGIFRTRVADGRTRKVVDTRCSDIDPRWSPDGGRILWQVLDGPAGGRSADAGLFTIGLGGLRKRTVLSGANRWFEPDWQPLR